MAALRWLPQPRSRGSLVSGISVVIPTKDRLPYLRRAVPMFLSHPQVAEVIIIVDGCQDETLAYVTELAQRDQRVRYFDNGRNRGLPYSRNKGIDMARQEYAFCGEDDLELTDDFFGTLLTHLRSSGADVISGRNIFRSENETPEQAISRADLIPGPAVDRRKLTVQTGIGAVSDQLQPLLPAPMLARTDIFRKVRFGEEYEVNFWREESDFQLSAQEHGYRLAFCPHAVSFNVMIANDRGGVHSVAGLRWVRWAVTNNWRFIRKHRDYIADHFDIGNEYRYITVFAAGRVRDLIVVPFLVQAKREVLAVLRARSARARPSGADESG
jgi:glycosyltransferase involved in cell wall biosynthesis